MESNLITHFSNLLIILIICSFSFSLFCDAAVNYQLLIQDPATGCLEWMANFYDLIMADLALILAIIFFLITALLADPMHHKSSNSYFSHSQSLEIFWTVVPALVLLSIVYPSLNLLYSLDDLTDPVFTVKIVGHHWEITEVPGRDLPVSDLIVEPCVSGETEEVPTDGLPLSDVEPFVSGGTEEVPTDGLPLSDVEPFVSGGTEEVPTEGLPLSAVEPLMSGETKEVPTEGLPLSDVEPFMSEETILVFAIVVLVTMDLVVYFLYY